MSDNLSIIAINNVNKAREKMLNRAGSINSCPTTRVSKPDQFSGIFSLTGLHIAID
jgi:hypothetical protein